MAGSLKRVVARTLVIGSFLALTACYHTITTTTLSPGTKVTQQWVPTFIAGLVPGKVDAQAICRGKPIQGVETQMSFLNWLVGAITFSIFTPLTVTVTCAG
jgi:hypothetical protein